MAPLKPIDGGLINNTFNLYLLFYFILKLTNICTLILNKYIADRYWYAPRLFIF
jgi:hypothetical protein